MKLLKAITIMKAFIKRSFKWVAKLVVYYITKLIDYRFRKRSIFWWGIKLSTLWLFAELGNYIYEPIQTYSSGMRSRLAFALSMAIDFEVYLVDEIMGVGDQGFRDKCKIAFNEKRKSSSLIMVSHSMDTIKDYSDIIILLTGEKLEIYNDVDEAIEVYKQISSRPR